MRVQNSVKNIIFGLSGQVISILMAIIVRTIFIYTLGIEYLGVDGLFTSLLMMLSLANLGFDTAMIYSLYKPLADENQQKIKALMDLYKRAYRVIGIVVLIIGLILLPFLPFLMNGGTDINHIEIIYLLFLINSVSSYFLVYKQSIIIADQRNHIISKIHTVFIIVSNLLQILILISLKSYILVLGSQILFRIIENIYIARKSNNLYPYLKENSEERLSTSERTLFYQELIFIISLQN